MEPWMSWGIALVVGGLAVFYYSSQKKPQAIKGRTSSVSTSNASAIKPTRRDTKPKPKPKPQTAPSNEIEASRPVESRSGDVSTSAAESAKKRKGAKKQPAPVAVAPAVVAKAPATAAAVEDDLAEENDNKAWAQQLLSLKKGTSLAAPVRTDSRNRTVKQSAVGVTPTFSSASSNGADADDDWTPSRSPALAAGGVSDMLEPTPSGPSVLRLTESSKPVKAKQQQRQTAVETAETKKQRQNRKKVEERRLQREAEEKERQVLLENQRRLARESRGEPAKNGLTAAKPPAASEWAVKAAARAVAPPTEAVSNGRAEDSGLLDTFEEDQMRMAKKLSEDESGWNTVPKGKKQKKTRAADVTDANESDSATGGASYVKTPVPESAPVSAQEENVTPAAKLAESYTPSYLSTPGFQYDAGSHPEDSAWSA